MKSKFRPELSHRGLSDLRDMDVNNEELFVEILIIEEILMWSFFPKHIFFVDGIEYDYLETTGTVYCQFIVGLKTQTFRKLLEVVELSATYGGRYGLVAG